MKQTYSFFKQALPVLGIAVLLGASVPAHADTCDNIGTLGDRWHRLSDYVDKHSDDGKLRKTEAVKVRDTAHELIAPTKALANVLVTEFSSKKADEARPKSLGKQLQANLEELSALGPDDDWDDVSAIVDKIGDILNKIADLCSEGK
jgi:hypothetical protein